ncbi:MAG: radical SAM protein [Ruminococcaceae bacterium]|nr:radical SAM protein [Oscillospiraceae bacterium]
MAEKHTVQKAAARAVLHKALNYVQKDPEANLIKLADKISMFFGNLFPPENFEKMKSVAKDTDNVWHQFALSLIRDLDIKVVEQMLVSLGIDAGYYGTKTVRANREKYKCNVPFIILFDPTSACNLKCKGCWAAEYGHRQSLSNEEMQSIVSQGKEMGTHFYMLTGGEPLIRKDDIIELARNNRDCAFVIYTNATLIDRKFCEDMNEVGNIGLALSLEGTEESNDWRRGEGAYKTTVEKMKLLHENKCLFGVSVCYTRRNVDAVTADSFMDEIIAKGAKYALYFNYMPVGHDADKELIPTPAQREYMYNWLKKVRNSKTGKPIFVMDFQNDAEYVGGCIAGGRNYFHINSAGDIEPCVFIHYSDTNIRTHTLLEALRSPLFTLYYKNQPFNDNHLRPCPMLENPEYLKMMVEKSGAHSSDLVHEESADELCAKCMEFAAAWAPEAERIWNSMPHKDTHTQYYRDTPEGKKECGGSCAGCNKNKD